MQFDALQRLLLTISRRLLDHASSLVNHYQNIDDWADRLCSLCFFPEGVQPLGLLQSVLWQMSTFATDNTHQRSNMSRPWPRLLLMTFAFDMTEEPRPSWLKDGLLNYSYYTGLCDLTSAVSWDDDLHAADANDDIRGRDPCRPEASVSETM